MALPTIGDEPLDDRDAAAPTLAPTRPSTWPARLGATGEAAGRRDQDVP